MLVWNPPFLFCRYLYTLIDTRTGVHARFARNWIGQTSNALVEYDRVTLQIAAYDMTTNRERWRLPFAETGFEPGDRHEYLDGTFARATNEIILRVGHFEKMSRCCVVDADTGNVVCRFAHSNLGRLLLVSRHYLLFEHPHGPIAISRDGSKIQIALPKDWSISSDHVSSLEASSTRADSALFQLMGEIWELDLKQRTWKQHLSGIFCGSSWWFPRYRQCVVSSNASSAALLGMRLPAKEMDDFERQYWKRTTPRSLYLIRINQQ